MGFVFNGGSLGLQDGTIDWAVDTIRVRLSATTENALVKTSTTMTGLGTTGNDVTLASKTGPTKDDTAHRVKYSCGNITFPSVATATERDKFIVFKFVTDDAGSRPIAVVDMSPPRTPNGGDINITISADGLFYTQQ